MFLLRVIQICCLIVVISTSVNSYCVGFRSTPSEIRTTTIMPTDDRFIIDAACQKGYIRVGKKCRKEFSK
ncbi:hypothetical protein HHI36_011462 [Cryptolaemus montrouzieri]|uniref:Uncharacterized protein n=1 Tax=Cryptolaemus montrouzieri TaxID=559131 RepID=A0ABD2MLR7_9CUCU